MDEEFEGRVRVRRVADAVVAELLEPHRVLSTSPLEGGMRDDVRWLVNHKMCEPDEHVQVEDLPGGSIEGYVRDFCGKLGIDPDRSAVMLTAASMSNAAVERRDFRQLSVLAIATAGVEVNAARAGDPAAWIEEAGKWQQVGTINIMALFSQPLTPGAMVKAAMVATEAKTAALHHLGVRSRYSDGLATGTGTDQIALAAPLAGDHVQSECGHHTKLGEILALAVGAAVSRSARMQDSPAPGIPERPGMVTHARLVAITGDGRGKTTSAMGLALRAVGQGYRVLVVQFIKGSWRTGEQDAERWLWPRLRIRRVGRGFVKDDEDIEEDRRLAQQGFEEAVAAARAGECDVLVLDEIHNALRKRLVQLDDVLDFLKTRPDNVHLVLTGRGAPREILELADTASEVRLVKHAMQAGVKATRGIEF